MYKHKFWFIFLALFILGVATVSAFAQGEVYTVCERGCDYQTVQSAIRSAQEGGTVKLGSGVYKGNWEINKDLTLEGDLKGGVKLQGVQNLTPVITVGPSDSEVTLRRLTFHASQGSGLSVMGEAKVDLSLCTITGSKKHGLKLSNLAEVLVENSDIHNNSWAGVEAFDKSRLTIINTNVADNEWGGIELSHSTRATINGVQIQNCLYGINLWDEARAAINNCTLTGNHRGILLSHSAWADIENNRFVDNFYGIKVWIKECGYNSAPESYSQEIEGGDNYFQGNMGTVCPEDLQFLVGRTEE